MPIIRAHINPEILSWARHRARFDTETAAQRIGVTVHRYEAWETRSEKPTLNQLRKIAKIFGRAPGFFYLERPPEEPETLVEMRALPSVREVRESPELAREVRLALERRQAALALHAELKDDPPELRLNLNIEQDPEQVAPRVREILGVSIETQRRWSVERSALRNWRTAFEKAGILVFQVPGVEIDEMRGFAVADRPLPIVAYNARDRSEAGRIFTIFHELSHVLIGSTTIDTPLSIEEGYRWRVESYCNHLAASVLVPRDRLLDLVERLGKMITEEREVSELSRWFGVSGSMMVRRLHRMETVSLDHYERLKAHFDSFRAPESEDDGGNVYRNRIVHVGRYLTELAFRSYSEDKLTVSDLSAIVNLQVKYLDNLADTMMSRAADE